MTRLVLFLIALFVVPLTAAAQDRNDFTDDEAKEIRAIFADLADAQESIAAAEKRLLDLILGHGAPPVIPPVLPPVKPPVEPPVIPIDPPIIVPPPTGARPGEDLEWNVRPKPPAADHDWVIRAGVAISQRGLGSVPISGDGGCGTAYRLSREAGDPDIVFAVYDDAGPAWIGGQYNRVTSPSKKDLTWVGELKASATFVGMTDVASVTLVFSSSNSKAVPTGDVLCFDIGIRGAGDSFIVRANAGSDHVQIDGCWWLARSDDPDRTYTSGIHIDNWGTLVIRRHKWRGPHPGDPGVKFREHGLAYLKSGRVSTIIELCDLYGGNRTGFQKRPEATLRSDGTIRNELPTDRFMIRGNVSANYGDNWDPGNPATSDGGAAITVWVSNGGTYIYDNVVTNFRYKAMSIGGQPTHKNYDFLATGNQHDLVYVSGNTFTPGPITERGTVGFSAIDYVRLYDDNDFTGRVTLNTKTNNTYNGLSNVTEEIWTQDGQVAWDLWRYDAAVAGEKRMTEEEVRALFVRY